MSILTALLLLCASLAPSVARQDATPVSGFANLGLPTMELTVTGDGYEGVPESVEAGRYLVTLSASEDSPEGGTVSFVQPSGLSPEEFLATLSDQSEATPVATAEASPGASPVAAAPTASFDAIWAGGTFAESGQTSQVVVDLTPGEWLVYGESPTDEPTVFKATGEMPADLPEPEASAALATDEYAIEVTSGELTAGQQIIKVENVGQQPHFISGDLGPAGVTSDQVGAAFEGAAMGTPAPDGFDPSTDLTTVFYTATQSPGTVTWHVIDLEPGTYVLACFYPDEQDGMPHASHGMYTVIEIAE
ncbi:MAG: hypothetical protein M3457_14685 [Chloroflexota bacterium]|nr:hypothetical protein [Chloroflexota bacterium]